MLAFIVLMVPLAVSAEYVTFYDAINDIQTLLGENPDAVWEMPREALKDAAGALEGFSCQDAGDSLTCKKSHWTGDFEITAFFSEDKAAALSCELTGPSIRDLNYQPGMTNIYCVTDLVNRMKSGGLISAGAAEQTGADLFTGTETSAYGPVYKIGGNTLLQAGYNSKSASHPDFSMTILAKAESADYELPAAAETAAGTEAEEGAADFGKQIMDAEAFYGMWDLDMGPEWIDNGNVRIRSTNIYSLLGIDASRLIFYENGTWVWADLYTDGTVKGSTGKWTIDNGTVTASLTDTDNWECSIYENESGSRSLHKHPAGNNFVYESFDYVGETADRHDSGNFLQTWSSTVYAPKIIGAQSAEDFMGQWTRAYIGKQRGGQAYGADKLASLTSSYLDIDDSWFICTVVGGEDQITTISGVSFENGNLSLNGAKAVLCDNGWIAVTYESDENNLVEYYVSVDPEKRQAPIPYTDAAEGEILLTVNGNAIEAGAEVRIMVSAPGADGIRLYTEGSDAVRKEAEGDSLDYSFSRKTAEPGTTYYAVASYGGVWSDKRSNTETVAIIPSTVLRVNYRQVVHAGDPFTVWISEFENVSEYAVRIYDDAGNLVRDVKVGAGLPELEPLTAGSYTCSITCVGNESHTLQFSFTVSDISETDNRLFPVEEDPNAQPALPASPEEPAGSDSADTGPLLGVWELYSYTTIVNNQADMEHCYFADDKNLRDSPLGVDAYKLIFKDEGIAVKKTSQGVSSISENGKWVREGSNIYASFSNGEKIGPLRIEGEVMTVLFQEKDGKSILWQFKWAGD